MRKEFSPRSPRASSPVTAEFRPQPGALGAVARLKSSRDRAHVHLGLGLLTWYYAKALTRPGQAHQAAQAAVKQHAQGEMALPPLGQIVAACFKRRLCPAITRPGPDACAGLGSAAAAARARGRLSRELRSLGALHNAGGRHPPKSPAGSPSNASSPVPPLRLLRRELSVARLRARARFQWAWHGGVGHRVLADAAMRLLQPTITPAVRPPSCRRVDSCSRRARSSTARWRPRSTRRCRA